MVQKALRLVVKEALETAIKDGLAGDHHFYISFATQFNGVEIPQYLKNQYPDDITIVLQHEFWDLEVWDDRFCVTLCFDDEYERLVVPFASLVGFADPSVKFGLQFTPDFSSEETTHKTSDDHSKVVSLDAFRKKR